MPVLDWPAGAWSGIIGIHQTRNDVFYYLVSKKTPMNFKKEQISHNNNNSNNSTQPVHHVWILSYVRNVYLYWRMGHLNMPLLTAHMLWISRNCLISELLLNVIQLILYLSKFFFFRYWKANCHAFKKSQAMFGFSRLHRVDWYISRLAIELASVRKSS